MTASGRLSVLLIGAGNIGKRTLQSFLKMSTPTTIVVVDPAKESLQAARDAVDELDGDQTHHTINYCSLIPEDIVAVDLAVIATSSKPRFAILNGLLKTVKVKNLILEKFLFQEREHYLLAEKLLVQHNIPCWVSCPRPIWPGYQSLSDDISGRNGNVMVVSGGGWNMASNAIHLLDCFAQVSGEELVSIDGSGLDPESFENKRAGYKEVSGQITARGANGGTATLICTPDPGLPLRVHWYSGGNRYFIDEGGENMEVNLNGTPHTASFPILKASELNDVYEPLLTKGTCGLSRYQQLTPMHLKLIDVLNSVFFPDDERGKACPVT